MSKIKNIAFLLLLIGVVVVSGCINNSTSTGNSPATGNPTSSRLEKQPSYIGNFRTQTDGDNIVLLFSLYDNNNNFMSASGVAKIRIVSDDGTTVYSENHNINKEDFGTFTQTLTGNQFQGVSFKIAASQIKKSLDNNGKVYLQFTTGGGSFEELESSVYGLPQFTKEEIVAQYENKYLNSSKFLNITERKGYFDVSLMRVGFFKHLKYDTFGDEVEEFRADIKVKNIATAENSFSTYDAKMIIGSSQYDRSYNSKFDSGDIYPGVIREGYIIFESVPKNVSGEAKIILGSHYDRGYVNYISEFSVLFASGQALGVINKSLETRTAEEIAKSSEQVQAFLKKYPDSKMSALFITKEALGANDKFLYANSCGKNLNEAVTIVTFMNSYPFAFEIVYIVDGKVDCII